MAKQVVNIPLLLRMNPDLEKAAYRGEAWALKHLSGCDQLNQGNYFVFEREPDGNPRRWCSGCPFEEGCITCHLP